MINEILSASTLVAALGCGLMAGVFFAFSTFVMKALASLPPAHGIAAMQSINVAVINPWFLGVFLGTAMLCTALGVTSLLTWHRPGAVYLLVGSAFYLCGTVMVTGAFNVPQNTTLASADPASAEAAKLWTGYVVSWSSWNHVRTVGALAAGASLIIALCLPRTQAIA
jgi:uncharacterized membrane protein